MIVIFDVDGTLLNIEHRVHLIRPPEGVKKDWKAFRAAAIHDTPNWHVVWTAQALHNQAHSIIVCTGRMEKERDVTYSALINIHVPFRRLYMRSNLDLRPDYVVKYEMLQQMRADGINPDLAFDDRQQVVDMWRANGVRCCQVAKGDF